jgi:hypothetical protein
VYTYLSGGFDGGALITSEFGKPQECRNGCGAWIYFDKDSKVGHPSPDKWIPLEYNKDAGIRTDQVHQCPNRPFFSSNGGTGTGTGSSSTIAATAGTEATTAPTKEDRILNMLNGITIKLDRLIALLEEKRSL